MIEGTSKVRNAPQRRNLCVDKHAIRDAWAVLWEKCTKARTAWVEQIHKIEGADWNPASDQAFRKHFVTVVDFGDDHKAGQIILGLNWLTQTYFLSGRHEELL